MTESHALTPYREALEQELRECFSERQGFLYNVLRYHMGWVDQQGQPETASPRASFHSLLAPVICEAVTGDYEQAMPVAAAIELLYNFSLVHGDVQAGRLEAGARPSIWWVWGPAQAINAGDGFHALARVAVMRLADTGLAPERVLRASEMLDRSCLAMCEGQYADLGFQDRMLVTTGEYDDMIARKSGALTGCSASGGALAAGLDEAEQEVFRDAGVKLGKAWQIMQDVADFWGREGNAVTSSNVLNKKKSLPLIHALENCSTSAKREIGTAYMKRVLESSDLARVVDIMDETGARAYSEERARQLATEAIETLETRARDPQCATRLRALGEMALEAEARD
ncbi:MAG: polyprenyl synthetase family protein [Chloroflexi bacterium]|nr:polyprenyl synthetase family protein [Chloroflexota bacterium]